MAVVQGVAGPVTSQDGGSTNIRQGRLSEIIVSDAHGKYNETTARGNVYQLNVQAGAATLFAGGAAGTPFVSAYNPVGSGKNLVILTVGFSIQASASGAGVASLNLWWGPSATPTGTATVPTNVFTGQLSGSIARGSSNAATTSSTALTNAVLPLASYYWATAASAATLPGLFDIAGAVVIPPGNMVALGASAALTSATYNVAMQWEEVPQ